MKPNNPLQVLKAAARYASIPIKRVGTSSSGKMLALAPREQWKNIQSLHPEQKILFRTLNVSPFEFRMSLAPWLLQDRHFTIIVMGKDLDFVETFCRRHNGKYVTLDAIAITESIKPNTITSDNNIPVSSWFRGDSGWALKTALDSDKPIFLYLPWIPEHGDAIIENIKCDDYSLSAFDMISDVSNNDIRREVFRFARHNPEIYRRLVIKRLAPIASKISGFVFTFDWTPVTRIIVEACRSLNIPTILVPHESVFIDADLYYKDLISQTSRPLTDYVLAWGDLQENIFSARGYDIGRIIKVGSPKLDRYFDNTRLISKDSFHDLYSLNRKLKTILFATQPLDSQIDMDLARDAQRAAISDLVRYVGDNNHQLIVRLPPSKDDIIGEQLRAVLEASPLCAIDDANFYLLPPHEVIKHVDAVTSINSTMLFEGVLAGKQAIAMRYIAFDSIWDQVGIKVAHNLSEAAQILDATFAGEAALLPHNMEWAAQQFGIGIFDGQASMRIKQFLMRLCDNADIRQHPLIEHMTSGKSFDVLGMPAYPELENISDEQLRKLLGTNSLVRFSANTQEATAAFLSGVDAFVQWGRLNSAPNIALQATARALGKKILTIDSGLVRTDSASAFAPLGASIILDDQAPHYETRLTSRLEDRLQNGAALTPEQEGYARAAIDQIIAIKDTSIAAPVSDEGPPVLIIDQCRTDPYFSRNDITSADFESMVCDALQNWPTSTIYIYRDYLLSEAGDEGHLSHSRLLNAGISSERIRFLERRAEPHNLFANTGAIYTISSKLGFDAILSGKPVTCYGQPFYSGWGLTIDKQPMARRTRQRSVLDVFHYACIDAARYGDPQTGERIDLQTYLLRMKEGVTQ